MHLPSRLCLEWQFLSLSRPSEARLARWRDVDTGKGTWIIPAERSKNARSHTVFLSEAMRQVLERARALRQPGREAFLFPGQVDGKPLSPLAVTRALKRLQPAVEAQLRKLTRDPEAEMAPFTWHDLRRTGASLVTSLGFSRFTAGLLLNHTDRSVTAIYDRNTYDGEKRRAWDEFGNLVTTLIQGNEKVVALRRRTKTTLRP